MTQWIAVDWGTSNLRAWALEGDRVIAEAGSDRGMARLTPQAFEPALMDLVADWPGRGDVIACGMVGARQGWVEAPYTMAPCPAISGRLTEAPCTLPGLRVRIVPGVAQARPADVMRGEETQIAGFLRLNPGWDGTLCLPGTHTKWVQISAGEIISFQTVMTGEVFAALSDHTVLRHTLGQGDDGDAFETAVGDAMSHPERLTARLFGLRAEGLLHGLSPGTARARLSGLLIGMDLAAARPWWLGAEIAIIGAGGLAGLYTRALAMQGVRPGVAESDTVTLAGLIAVHERNLS